MNISKRIKIPITYFVEVCNKARSIAEASRILGLKYDTVKFYAHKYNCFNPNQRGVGIPKNNLSAIPLSDILTGGYPDYNTYRLKLRLIKEKVFENRCYICGIDKWNGLPLRMELHHIDGNSRNHKKDNLQLLCPNCHSLTSTFRGSNVGATKKSNITDIDFINALNNSYSIREALLTLDLAPRGGNYKRAYKLLEVDGCSLKTE